MPINEKIQRKARNLRSKLNNKRKNNKATHDEEEFAETAQAIYDEYRYQVQKADEAEGKLKGFRKELLETGEQKQVIEWNRQQKIQDLTLALEASKKEHADKLKTMQPVSATAELQAEVQLLNDKLQEVRVARDNMPHDRFCHTRTVNSPRCTCWKNVIKEIIG